jgi:hypothetical protein
MTKNQIGHNFSNRKSQAKLNYSCEHGRQPGKDQEGTAESFQRPCKGPDKAEFAVHFLNDQAEQNLSCTHGTDSVEQNFSCTHGKEPGKAEVSWTHGEKPGEVKFFLRARQTTRQGQSTAKSFQRASKAKNQVERNITLTQGKRLGRT